MSIVTVRDMINRAGRLDGSLASGDSFDVDGLNDAMTAANSMKRAMFGTFIGPRLSPQDCAGLTAQQAENGGVYQIPVALFVLTAPANPRAGARFGVSDANLSFLTDPCTINRNGRLLEGAAANLLLNVSGDNRVWFFDADAGNWIREADWASPDAVIEFPARLAAYLPYMLAVANAPEYGADLRSDVVAGAAEGRAAFARQYHGRGANQVDPPIGVQGGAPAAQQGR